MVNQTIIEVQKTTVLEKTFQVNEKKIHEKLEDDRNIGQKRSLKKINRVFIQMKVISAIIFALLLAINLTLVYYLLIVSNQLHESIAIGIVVIAIAVTIFVFFSELSGYRVIKNLVRTMRQELILSYADIHSFEDRLDTTKSTLFMSQISKILSIIKTTCYVHDEDKAYIRGLSIQMQEVATFQESAQECIISYNVLLEQSLNMLKDNQENLQNAYQIRDEHLPSSQNMLDEKRASYQQMGGIKQQENYVIEKNSILDDHKKNINELDSHIKVYDQKIKNITEIITKHENALADLVQEFELSQKNMQEQTLAHTTQKQQVEKDLLSYETSAKLEEALKNLSELEAKRNSLVEGLNDSDANVQIKVNEEMELVSTKITSQNTQIATERDLLRAKRTAVLERQNQLVEQEQKLNLQRTSLDAKNAKNNSKMNIHKEEITKHNKTLQNLVKQKEEESQKQIDETHRMRVCENKYEEMLAPYMQLQKEINLLENEVSQMSEQISKIDPFNHAIAIAEQLISSNQEAIEKLKAKLSYFDQELKNRNDMIDKLCQPYM